MKKLFCLMLVLVMMMAQTTVGFAAVQTPTGATERVIVKYKASKAKSKIVNLKAKVRHEYKHVNAMALSLTRQQINKLEEDPDIKVEPDVVVRATAQTADWGIAQTTAPTAWSSGYTGKGVKVAVIDTGVATHSDIPVAGGASFGYNSYIDDNGHGTHVAGIIGARNNTLGTVGIAPDAQIYAVKVLDASGSGYLSDVIAGVDWAITNQMHIINMSLGMSTSSSLLESAVNKAYSQGILVVAAAGNSGTSTGTSDSVEYPAKYDSVIAVAATDSANQRGYFSSTGPDVEVAAPGVNIYSTYLNNTYATMSGTSMAAPYVAGDLALLKEANAGASAAQLRQMLQQRVLDLGTAGKDTWFGYGLIQAPVSTVTPPEPPAEQQATVTTVSTDKAIYRVGNIVTIKTKVTNASGTALSGATVVLTVTNPKGVIQKFTGTTNSLGVFTVNPKYSVKGTYKVNAAGSYTGYTSSNQTKTFIMK
ncbi:S8 family serine peptidase [Heliophilum fasciatum]|nr:S8 family serine peptidase [Heliophilum fasciatum]MCW2278221.1 minor extracellular protease Epr [Heliophilum fasciatum]